MRLLERRPAVLVITESIEMELFTSEESYTVVPTQEDEHNFCQRYLEHPLVPETEEEDSEPQVQVQVQPKPQAKPSTAPAPRAAEAEDYCFVPGSMEEIEIEMEVFPPIRVSESEVVEINSDHPSIMTPPSQAASPNRTRRLKWRRLAPEKTGLVVKDVICLPRGHCPALLDRHIVPRGKEQAALVAMGMTARITIDYGWSANQMESRLAVLFRRQFVRQPGQRFSFTYLQCVQGSRVLFVPDAPTEGWTGEQVLRLCGHGLLYILSHHDFPQAESDCSASKTSEVNNKDFCLEASTESCLEDENQLWRETQRRVRRTTEEFTLDLATVLRLFRQENMDVDVQTHVHVRRRDLLHSALKVLRRPGFCFRTTPVISFSGEEADGHEGPLREFFRLALLELQQSSVFEGHQGHLFLTYDLTSLEDRKYYEAGVLIGWSLAQGGPGPRCLHPVLYQLMCGHNPPLEDFDCRDIVDAETQIRLQQLKNCTSVKLLPASVCDWVASCGIPGIYSARSADLSAIYSHLVKHYIYHRVASMISQFTKGLDSCGGLWETVQSHWEAFVPVMTSAEQQPLSLEEFTQLFTVCYSDEGSQFREAEEATAQHWERILALVNDGRTDFSFEDLLTFITGADHLPPLGFPRSISLRFYCQDVSMSSVRLPHTSTCALELFLPRGATSTQHLCALLSRAVHESLGFGHIQAEGDGEGICFEVVV
ncbi:G2/M phase-specific E3 ubiquitin-protein ligase-like [Myripristis murdjan]|uniref:G2/M phase-specific E3 ubiquitin-protein ligase-like n=1 Tax=Myripristis murdjan TaxID=586833 RepID=A0A667ZT50_9TELE|nr:G2/M phase-specific E3 ubiquitin-protein ligase-like [Myripristis murdjan]